MLKILSINDSCTGCGACVSTCPKGALTLSYNEEGFYYPHLNEDKCVDCHLCEKVCHVLKNDLPENPSRDFRPVMLKAKSKDLLFQSSSGGAFSLLADVILKEGGVVYGARYNYEKERLEHCSTDECSIEELRKSKYIESYMGSTFQGVRKNLRSGRKVMFCGTPCQVKGLINYLEVLKVPQDNLLTVRFICHGVPANKFFTEYKHYIEKKIEAKVVYLDFRTKTTGWRSSDMYLKFSNEKIVCEPYIYNYYYYYFQRNYLLRSSCYTCDQILQTTGDITIADFWGIFKYRPENKDQEGISLVLAQSPKAEQILRTISDYCDMEELPQSAVDYIYKDGPTKKTLLDNRRIMMSDVIKKGYMPTAKKVIGKTIFLNRTKGNIRGFLKRVGLWKLIRG